MKRLILRWFFYDDLVEAYKAGWLRGAFPPKNTSNTLPPNNISVTLNGLQRHSDGQPFFPDFVPVLSMDECAHMYAAIATSRRTT